MKSVHKALNLSHHKHTGKILHHRHTSYGTLLFIMLIPVFLLLWIGQVSLADGDIQVNAVVPQLPPPFAPTITTPTDGTRYSTDLITVSGHCPLANPAVIIAIYEGTSLVGSATCSNATGTYSLPVSLTYGTHTIVATVITFTGQVGLSSNPVTVTRFFNLASQPKNFQTQNTLPQNQQLIIVNTQPVINFGPTLDANLKLIVTHGTPPYKVHITWGDGKSNDYYLADQSLQSFSHHYDKPGIYIVNITITDADGNTTSMRVVAESTTPLAMAATASKDATDLRPGSPNWWIQLIQSPVAKAYIATFLIVFIIWLIARRRHHNDTKVPPRTPYRPAHV